MISRYVTFAFLAMFTIRCLAAEPAPAGNVVARVGDIAITTDQLQKPVIEGYGLNVLPFSNPASTDPQAWGRALCAELARLEEDRLEVTLRGGTASDVPDEERELSRAIIEATVDQFDDAGDSTLLVKHLAGTPG